MKHFWLLILFTTLIINKLSAQKSNYIPNTIIVKYSTEKSATDRKKNFETTCQLKVKSDNQMFKKMRKDKFSAQINNIYKIEYEGDKNPIVVAEKLMKSENIEYAQPYWVPEILDMPNDPKLSSQYHFNITQALEAQEITQGDTNIVIGIVDTGVDIYHEDLVDNIKYNYADPINGIDDDNDGYVDNFRGWDLACNDDNPISTTNHHGTHVAGIAAACTNNGIGVAGIGYKTKFLPIKVSDDDEGSMIACYEGIVYAADHGCQIINCSWGSPSKNPIYDDVIKYAQSRGCLIIAAAGNTGTDVKYYPASSDGVFSVGATNAADERWTKSTYNNRIDISAPGENVFTTHYNNTYQTGSGTSLAAPVVSGAAALAWSIHPDYTATQIAELLRVTTDNIDTIAANTKYSGKIGSGRLNILKALTDSTSPSIRITDYEFKTDDNKFTSGTEITLKFNIINYLNAAKNVIMSIEVDNDCATIKNGTWAIDSIGCNEKLESPTISIALSNSLKANQIIPFYVNFNTDGYSALQVLELTVNPTYIDVEWGEMKTTIADNGKIGIYDYDAQLGNGFLYEGTKNLMSDGALIIALDSLTIASAFQTDNQFIATQKPILTKNGNVQEITSTLKPTNINGIEIEQKFIFDTENLPTAMICNYLIHSTRAAEYDNSCVGLYFDWDIVNSLTNAINYDNTLKMAYIYNIGEINRYAGVSLLSIGNAVPYAFELSENGGSTNIVDEFSDEQKWLVMNNTRPQSYSANIDLAMILSCNKLTLHNDDTINIRFAIMAAENLYELKQVATKAAEIYGEKTQEIDTTENTDIIENQNNNRLILYPNPISKNLLIESNSEIEEINIYNAIGKLMLSKNFDSAKNCMLNTSSLESGIYIIEIINNEGEKTRKLVEKL